MNPKVIIGSIVAGIVISLVTGWVPGYLLYTITSGFHNLAVELMGASNYGLPLVWRTVIVYPGWPTVYHVVGLVVDVVVWTLVAWVILNIFMRRNKLKT
jgi:hypothetical protein